MLKIFINFYLHLKISEKKIETIDFNFSYSFAEKIIILNDIMIDGKYNQKVNTKINSIYLPESDLQNKIYFKNLMNDIIQAYAG